MTKHVRSFIAIVLLTIRTIYGDCESPVSLLQADVPVLHIEVVQPKLETEPSTGKPELLAWFHCPKCSTGFANTIMHYFNSSLPDDAAVRDENGLLNKDFKDTYPENEWFPEQASLGLFSPLHDSPPHAEIKQSAWKDHQGDFIGFFREPKDRMHSSWNHFTAGDGSDPESYAHSASGIVTKMLAGQENGLHCSYPKGSETHWGLIADRNCNRAKAPDVELALERLDGFRFVGLHEHFSLSICLFHTVVGGECLPVDFMKVRGGDYDKAREPEAKQVFEDSVDVADTAIYTKAAAMFWDSVAQHSLNRSACEKLCPKVDPVEFEILDFLVPHAS